MSIGNEVSEVEARMATERIIGLFMPYLSEDGRVELAGC